MKAIDLNWGDRYPHPFTDDAWCVVDHVETYGRKKMGTDVPMVKVFLINGPSFVKHVQVPGDREVAQH